MADQIATPDEVNAFLGAPTQAASRAPTQTPDMMRDGIATPNEADAWLGEQLRQEKYGTGVEKVKTAAEGALASATFGLSTGLEKMLFNNADQIRERREENPGSHIVGQTVGLLGPGGILGKAGQAGAGALGLGLEGAGVASRLGASAVKGAIETALVQSGDEVSKMLSEDPHQTAETAAANIGMAALLGGGLGGAMGGAGELWDATVGKKVGASLDAASHAINSDPPPPPTGPTFLQTATGDGLDASQQNAGLLEASSRLGVDPNSTPDAFQKDLSKIAQSPLRDATLKTEAQVGREIKDGISETLEKELKPIEQNYNSLKSDMKKVPMTLGDIMEASGRVLDHEFVAAEPKFKPLAEELVERFKRISNMDELKTQRTLISEELSEAYRSGSPKARILQTAKDALTELRENALKRAAEEGTVAPEVLEKIQQADLSYANYKNKLKALGVEAGIGKINNARGLLESFAKSSDESFASKIFDTGDVNQLKFFKDNFPKEFELARRYKLREIAEKSINEAQGARGQFSLGKFLSQVSDVKMNPEAREVLFPGHTQTIQDLRTIHQATPPKDSGLGKLILNVLSHLIPGGGMIRGSIHVFEKAAPFLQEAANLGGGSDASQLAALKFAANTEKGVNASAFRQMSNFIAETVKGESKFAKATSAVFDSSKQVLGTKLFPQQKDRDKLDEKLKGLQANNAPLFDVGGNVGHYLPDHGTAVAQIATNASGYLNSLRPSTDKKNPLDSDIVPSKMQKSAYNRALDIAQEPLVVLDSLKEGTLTPHDLVTFKTIYPSLYARTSQKLMNNLIETTNKGVNIPYKTRLGLSMFLGQPLDSTMTPEGIMSAQPKLGQPSQQPQQQGGGHARGSMKDLGKIAQADMTPLQARQISKVRK